MLLESPDFPAIDTPAFVYDESRILRQLALLSEVREKSGVGILYSIKALPFAGVVDSIRPWVEGFSVSSLFEARLAAGISRRVAGDAGRAITLHITTPGLRAGEIGEIAGLCDYLAFNSLEQCQRLRIGIEGRISAGIRVNPRVSFLDDLRYDPCRPFSKLGVPIDDLAVALAEDGELASGIDGLHFHTSFESRSVEPLRIILAKVERVLGPALDGIRWINLGGGYLIDTEEDARELAEAILEFKCRRAVKVFFEPGKAIVGEAGNLVASVIDRFERDGKTIAVLDTGVHHLPEVFEYQKSPRVAGQRPDGRYEYLLAGCSCLAGDVFGEYRFDTPLRVGDRVAFLNVGAYSQVKATRFNGYDLPDIHAVGQDGKLRLLKRHGYEDYLRQWSADAPTLAGNETGI